MMTVMDPTTRHPRLVTYFPLSCPANSPRSVTYFPLLYLVDPAFSDALPSSLSHGPRAM